MKRSSEYERTDNGLVGTMENAMNTFKSASSATFDCAYGDFDFHAEHEKKTIDSNLSIVSHAPYDTFKFEDDDDDDGKNDDEDDRCDDENKHIHRSNGLRRNLSNASSVVSSLSPYGNFDFRDEGSRWSDTLRSVHSASTFDTLKSNASHVSIASSGSSPYGDFSYPIENDASAFSTLKSCTSETPYGDFHFRSDSEVPERISSSSSISKHLYDDDNSNDETHASPYEDFSFKEVEAETQQSEEKKSKRRDSIGLKAIVAALGSQGSENSTVLVGKTRERRRQRKKQKRTLYVRLSKAIRSSRDPVDQMLVRISRTNDPVNWAVFTMKRADGSADRRPRVNSKSRLRVATFGEDKGLVEITEKLRSMRLGIGVARFVVHGRSKFALLTNVSDDGVGGHEIFLLRAKRTILKEKFRSFDVEIFARDGLNLDPTHIIRGG